jgi:hypothetical protein
MMPKWHRIRDSTLPRGGGAARNWLLLLPSPTDRHTLRKLSLVRGDGHTASDGRHLMVGVVCHVRWSVGTRLVAQAGRQTFAHHHYLLPLHSAAPKILFAC